MGWEASKRPHRGEREEQGSPLRMYSGSALMVIPRSETCSGSSRKTNNACATELKLLTMNTSSGLPSFCGGGGGSPVRCLEGLTHEQSRALQKGSGAAPGPPQTHRLAVCERDLLDDAAEGREGHGCQVDQDVERLNPA